MATYLVTGGCGFIGSHLADALLEHGHRVRIIDNLSTGKRENAPSEAEVIIGDICNPEAMQKAFRDIDGCFHLAAIASVEKSREDWLGTHHVNLSGSIHVFDLAQRANPMIPIVYASSAAVYGDNPNTPLAESATTIPLTAYGADKLGCELHAYTGAHVYGLNTTGCRFFNVYGPRQDPSSPYSGVISIFADRIRRGNSITIYGDGEQSRDFIYVGDVVAFLLRAMEKNTHGARVFNVCTGRSTSVSKLADTLEKLTGQTVERITQPARKGDIRTSIGNPSHAAEKLGLHARITLEEGLKTLI